MSGDSVTDHLPESSATVLALDDLSFTVTCSPGSALPHILIGCSRWSTTPSDSTEGRVTAALIVADNDSRAAARMDVTGLIIRLLR